MAVLRTSASCEEFSLVAVDIRTDAHTQIMIAALHVRVQKLTSNFPNLTIQCIVPSLCSESCVLGESGGLCWAVESAVPTWAPTMRVASQGGADRQGTALDKGPARLPAVLTAWYLVFPARATLTWRTQRRAYASTAMRARTAGKAHSCTLDLENEFEAAAQLFQRSSRDFCLS